jgi:hypothetical protein
VTRIAVPAVLLLAACATPSPAPQPHQGPPLAQCYAIRYTDDDAAVVFPARIGFPGEGDRVWGEPDPRGRRYWGMFGPGMRTAVAGDSVRVVFSNGFSGIVLTFAEGAGSLAGSAYFASDVVGPTPPPRTPFTGSRIPCPA